MPHQDALTIVSKVDPTRIERLEKELAHLRKDPAHNEVVPFAKIPGCHFGRIVFLPATKDLRGRAIEPQLMMLSDCDGPSSEHLTSFVDTAGDGIDRLFGNCVGYPRLPATRQKRVDYLRKQHVRTKANYIHRQGRTVDQIRNEAKLRDDLQEILADRDFEKLSALEVRNRIISIVENSPSLQWALDAPEGIGWSYRARNLFHFTTLPLSLLFFGPVLLPTALLTLALVRLQEQRDHPEHLRPSLEHVHALTSLEDFFAQNGFTAGGFVKPGWLRQAVVSSVLPLIGYGTRHLFTRESLAGIKTIHFARWIPLDRGRRMVFASNYDGSLESYNNDFIDLVAWGLNLVFSNGLGYPKTRWLLFGGATLEQEFKDYLRRHQIPTPIWYSAYPRLTAVNIVHNARLRAGLRGRMTEQEARAWLRLL